MKKSFKLLKVVMASLLACALASCVDSSSSSSSSSSASSQSTSSSTVSSSSSSSATQQVYGEVPAGVTVLTVAEAVAHMQSSSWVENEDMCVKGEVEKVKYDSQYSSYTIDLVGGFQIYSGKLSNGLPAPEVGDTVVASGKSKIYTYSSGDKVYEIAYASSHKVSPTIHQVTKGESEGNGNNNNQEGQVYGEVPAGVTVLTVSDAVSHMQSSSWVENEDMCVKGEVEKVKYDSQYSSYTIDLVGGFQIYSGKLANGLPAPEVGDTVVASGKSKIYTYSSGDKVYEIAYASSHKVSPTIHQVIKG